MLYHLSNITKCTDFNIVTILLYLYWKDNRYTAFLLKGRNLAILDLPSYSPCSIWRLLYMAN